MMLLNLPPELLESILCYLDPQSFSVLLLVNKVLREDMLSNAHALHVQIKALPGLHLCEKDCEKDSKELYDNFCERAARYCANGVTALCDANIYKAEFPTQCSLSEFCILKGGNDPWELAAAVDNSKALVHVYSLQDGFPLPKYSVEPDPFYLDPSLLQIMLVYFHELANKRHITILYQQKRHNTLEGPHYPFQYASICAFYQSELLTKSNRSVSRSARILKLVTYSLTPSEGVQMVTLRIINNVMSDNVPIAMSAANGKVILLLRVPRCCSPARYSYKLKVYQTTNNLIEHDPQYHSIVSNTPHVVPWHDREIILMESRIIKMVLGDDKVLRLYQAGDQIPQYQISSWADEEANAEGLPRLHSVTDDTFFGTHRWLPLATRHNHRCMENPNGEKSCVSSVLQLAALRTKTGKYSKAKRKPAFFLVKGSFDSDTCKELELDKPFPQLEHEVVAILRDVDFDQFISHGHITALTNQANVLAIATWDRVQIFYIESDAFLNIEEGSLNLPGDRSSNKKKNSRRNYHFANYSSEFAQKDDYTYSKNCGQGFYRSYAKFFDKRIVGIRPVELPRCGVVYTLKFTDDGALWGWTDQGLVRWWWGPGRNARREHKILHSGPLEYSGPVHSKTHLPTIKEDWMELQVDLDE